MNDASAPWGAIVVNFLSFIQIASWPTITIVVILMFRSQIGQILVSIATRQTKVTLPGGWTLDLAETQSFMERFAPEIAELLEIQRRSPNSLIGGEEAPPGTVDEEPVPEVVVIPTENVDEGAAPAVEETEDIETVDE